MKNTIQIYLIVMKNSFSSCRYNGIAMRHEADVFFNEIHPNTALLSADCVCGSGDMSLLLTQSDSLFVLSVRWRFDRPCEGDGVWVRGGGIL